MTQGLTIDEVEVGQRATFTKTISESDVYLFAGITGDLNGLHVDETYARETRFGRRIAHGMLVASLISSVQARELPGPGNIYVSQTLRFVAPVFIGDTITARVEVTEVVRERNRIRLLTECVNQEGVVVVSGESEVVPRRSEQRQ